MTFHEVKIGTTVYWEGDSVNKAGQYRKIATEHATELRTGKIRYVPRDAEVEAAPAEPKQPKRKA